MPEPVRTGWSRLSTDAVAASERLDYWLAATNAVFPPTGVRRADPAGFYGKLSWLTFGEITMADIVSNDLVVSRAEEHIDRDDQWFEVTLQVEGVSAFNQGGRDVVTTPRSMVLYDSRRPYRMAFEGHYRQISLKVPRRPIVDRIPHIDRLLARVISTERVPGRFFYDFVLALADMRQEEATAMLSARIESHVIDLLATALSGVSEALPLSAGREAQLGRIKTHILAHLDDPALSPAGIAKAEGLSLRSLYELFEHEEERLVQWIKSQRLERIRSDLADPLQAGLPITTIALKRGFKDFSHFSRAFRSRFEIAPRDYRRAQLCCVAK
ncbi:AraC-like ligand-binding domain-containing protein [Martelella alba]|nr:helix-turn-helix domain-containing protein [Martelella alba]